MHAQSYAFVTDEWGECPWVATQRDRRGGPSEVCQVQSIRNLPHDRVLTGNATDARHQRRLISSSRRFFVKSSAPTPVGSCTWPSTTYITDKHPAAHAWMADHPRVRFRRRRARAPRDRKSVV